MTIIKEGSVSTDLQVSVYLNDKKSVVRAIRQAIISENDATNMYEKIVDAIEYHIKTNVDNAEAIMNKDLYQKVISTLQDIANEEKVHIGELHKVLSLLDGEEIGHYKDGAEEVGNWAWKNRAI